MSDDNRQTDRPDRARVAADESYEVKALSEKFALPPVLVKRVIQQEGPTRREVETYLRKMKSSSEMLAPTERGGADGQKEVTWSS